MRFAHGVLIGDSLMGRLRRAVVIIGGLISAPLLTLIVLPTLYLIFIGRGEPVGDDPPAAESSGDTKGGARAAPVA
jgi:hypothetical protein